MPGVPGVKDVMGGRRARTGALWGLVAIALSTGHAPLDGAPAPRQSQTSSHNLSRSTAELEGAAATPSQGIIDQYCVGCHNRQSKAGGLVLQGLDVSRVGEHAVFEPLAAAARDLARAAPSDPAAEFLRSQSDWDPYRFVDLCDAIARGKSTSENLARQIARAEWQLLFADCYRRAVGE